MKKISKLNKTRLVGLFMVAVFIGAVFVPLNASACEVPIAGYDLELLPPWIIPVGIGYIGILLWCIRECEICTDSGGTSAACDSCFGDLCDGVLTTSTVSEL